MADQAAVLYTREQTRLLSQAAEALRTSPTELPTRATALTDEIKTLRRQLEQARQSTATETSVENDVGGVRLVTRELQDIPAKELRPMADKIKGDLGSGVAAIVSVNEGRASLVVSVTKDLTRVSRRLTLCGGGVKPLAAQAVVGAMISPKGRA